MGAAAGPGWTSVSQRKRLTMAVELAANCAMLFLDEPTTGLDNAGANVVTRAMQDVARQGVTVVCTIHQVQLPPALVWRHGAVPPIVGWHSPAAAPQPASTAARVSPRCVECRPPA